MEQGQVTEEGKLVVIEGPDFSGKTTVVAEAEKFFGDRLITTREPGGKKGFAPLSLKFRVIALESEYARVASGEETSAFMWASRVAHIFELILPALLAGKNVLCDRFAPSTWAYNIVAQKAPGLKKHFWLLYDLIVGEVEPHLYIYFDVTPEEVARRKMMNRPDKKNHMDEKDLEFQMAMRAGFQEFFEELAKRKGRICHVVIDANQSPEKVLQDVKLILEDVFGKK